jgi:hypothetical protein
MYARLREGNGLQRFRVLPDELSRSPQPVHLEESGSLRSGTEANPDGEVSLGDEQHP